MFATQAIDLARKKSYDPKKTLDLVNHKMIQNLSAIAKE